MSNAYALTSHQYDSIEPLTIIPMSNGIFFIMMTRIWSSQLEEKFK